MNEVWLRVWPILQKGTSVEQMDSANVDAVEFVRQHIKPMLTIVDTCDTINALRQLNPKEIIAAEFGLSNGRTDLTAKGSLQYADPSPQADLAAALGILECFPQPQALLSELHALDLPVLCSINLHSDNRNTAAMKLTSFESLVCEAGFSVVWRFMAKKAAIYLLAPVGRDSTAVTSVGFRSSADTVTVLQPKRPALLVAGFFGRSNCGDEALLQVIYEQFSPDFEIIVSLDEHGATEGYWNLYPYDRCQRIHQGNLADPARSASGMIVGGGGLPLGFVADQILAARSAGIPIAFVGTDFPVTRLHAGRSAEDASRDYLRLFDYVALRSLASVKKAKQLGHHVVHGADWALRLLTDEDASIRPVADRALVVLREFPLAAISFYYVEQITHLLESLRDTGFIPTMLPFCMEDDRFARALGLDLLAPTERHWWNARRVKQLISSSGLVISVGRLHPMIFAAGTKTPVIQLCPPLSENIDPHSFSKISEMSAELGVDYLPTVTAINDHIKLGHQKPCDAQALKAAQWRLGRMIGDLRNVLKRPR